MELYATPGAMTALPAHLERPDLPADPEVCRATVQGLLVHRDLISLYGLPVDAVRAEEQNLRSARQVIERALELSDAPIGTVREPSDRVIGICRHFAVLHTAFLRAAGIPARARCGFGGYFEAGQWTDHWISERWDGRRWVRDDPQIDDAQRSLFGLDFDPHDQPDGRFLDGFQAWRATRAGDLDPERFGIFDMWGQTYIAGNLLTDLAALNKVELLPWDAWGIYRTFGPHDPLPEEVATLLDDLCAVAEGEGPDGLRARYRADDRLRVPAEISTILNGAFTTVTIET